MLIFYKNESNVNQGRGEAIFTFIFYCFFRGEDSVNIWPTI